MATGTCAGMLLVHRDGSAAACTEELHGRCCPGPGLLHLGGRVLCEEVVGITGCELCAVDAWGERDWRHAVHVGRISTTARCVQHRREAPSCRPASQRAPVAAPGGASPG